MMDEASSDEEFEFASPVGGNSVHGKGTPKGGLAEEFSMYAGSVLELSVPVLTTLYSPGSAQVSVE